MSIEDIASEILKNNEPTSDVIIGSILKECVEPLLETFASQRWKKRRLFDTMFFAQIKLLVSRIRSPEALRKLRGDMLRLSMNHIDRQCAALRQIGSNIEFLRALSDAHDENRVLVRWLTRVFSAIERERDFVCPPGDRDSIPFAVYTRFARVVYVDGALSEALEAERGLIEQDRIAIRAAVAAFAGISRVCPGDDLTRADVATNGGGAPAELYVRTVEQEYLRNAEQFLHKQLTRCISEHKGSVWIDGEYRAEVERCMSVMHMSTTNKLERMWFERVVAARTTEFATEFTGDFAQRSSEENACTWKIVMRSGIAQAFATALSGIVQSKMQIHIRERETRQTQLRQANVQMALRIVREYKMATDIVRTCFQADELCLRAISSATSAALDRSFGDEKMEMCVAQLIDAFFCGEALDGDQRETPEFASSIAEVCMLLAERDLFIEQHRRLLALRALSRRTKSLDNEAQFVSLLKASFGIAATQKVEAMISDMRLWDREDPQFPPIQTSVRICTNAHWPAFRQFEIGTGLPLSIAHAAARLSASYSSLHSSRRLEWSMLFSSVDVAVDLPRFRGIAVVNMPQVCILIHFNSVKVSSFSQLRDTIDVSDDILRKAIHSLVFSPRNLLRRIDNRADRTIRDTDEFQVNESFESRERRFSQPCAPLHEQTDSSAEVSVLEQRKVQLEAAIVRIMKARRRLSGSDIIREVISQTRNFAPTTRSIKDTIELLLEREYLERDSSDQGVFMYLA